MLFLLTELHCASPDSCYCKLGSLQGVISETLSENKRHNKCKRRCITTLSSSIYEEHDFSKDVHCFCQISLVQKFQIGIIKFSQGRLYSALLLLFPLLLAGVFTQWQKLGYPNSWTWDSQVACCRVDLDYRDIFKPWVQARGVGGVHYFYRSIHITYFGFTFLGNSCCICFLCNSGDEIQQLSVLEQLHCFSRGQWRLGKMQVTLL